MTIVSLGVLGTLVVSTVPSVDFAYRSPSLHLVLDTTTGLIALLAAYLVFGRFRLTRRASDLGLACALGIFAVASLALSALPQAIDSGIGSFVAWAPLIAGLLGDGLLALCAWGSRRRLTTRGGFAVLGSSAAAVTTIVVVVAVAGQDLPQGIDPALSSRDAPTLGGDAALLSLQLVAAALFAAAAVGFARSARRSNDELLRWFAAGAVLGAFARVNYFLFPSLYSGWVYTGDVFRLAFYLVILVGAAREIGSYWRAEAKVAVLEERRRIARDLHDGLAQELSYIVSETRRIARLGGPPVNQVSDAAERALDESRRAIAALSLPLDEPLGSLLSRVAEDVGMRGGLRVELDVDSDLDAPVDIGEALLRVVREAVTNAAKHSHATTVRVAAKNGDPLRVRITDDGQGFDPSASHATPNGGLGLTSMRERVEGLGGRFRVESAPGRGTEIDVVLP